MDETTSILNVLTLLWSKKWKIISLTFSISVLALVFALFQPKIYQSTLVFQIQSSNQNSNLGELASLFTSQLNTDDNSQNVEAVLNSKKIIIDFIQDEKLIPLIFPEDTILHTNPSYLKAEAVFRKNFLFFELGKKSQQGLLTLGINHQDSLLAFNLVQKFSEHLVKTITKDEVEQSQKAINFYHEQLKTTTSPALSIALSKLIAEETKAGMILGRNLFKVIDPAYIAEKPISPNVKLIAIIGCFLGLVLSIALILIIDFVNKIKTTHSKQKHD